MKRQHESKATEPFVISDETARHILLLMAGATIGAGVAEVIRGVGDFARTLANAVSSRPDRTGDDDGAEKFLKELDDILRYGPKGPRTRKKLEMLSALSSKSQPRQTYSPSMPQLKPPVLVRLEEVFQW